MFYNVLSSSTRFEHVNIASNMYFYACTLLQDFLCHSEAKASELGRKHVFLVAGIGLVILACHMKRVKSLLTLYVLDDIQLKCKGVKSAILELKTAVLTCL